MEIKNKIKIKDYKEIFSSSKLAISYTTALIFGIFDNDSENKNKNIIQSNKEKNQTYDPILKLVTNYDEIQKIINAKEKHIYKFLYFNRRKVHKILYDLEEMINVDFEGIEKTFSSYFYLSLLIEENPNEINYTYSIDLINELNKLQKNNYNKDMKE